MRRRERQALRVLLVEDSADDAELAVMALSEGGFRVVKKRVACEAEMRDAMREGGWDAVLSDFNLPGFSVRAALSLVRESDEDIPFVVVSGAMGEENVVALMKEGVSDFVMKDKLARLAPVLERALADATVRREHRHTQERVRGSEKMLRGVAAALGEGLLVQNWRGELVMMNPEAERLLGWTERELLGKKTFETIYWQEPGEAPVANFSLEMFGMLANGGVYRTEGDVFVRKDGTLIPVSFITTPLMERGKMVAAVTAFQDISLRKQAEHDLILSREQLRELSLHLLSVREEERTRIARELHDGLGQMLAAIKLDAQWLDARLAGNDAGVRKKFAAMIDLVDRTVEAMRRMAANLRPVMLDDLGLSAAIEWLAEEVAEHSGLSIRLDADLGAREEELDNAQKTALYRIAQECLTNVVRHACARKVVISLHCMDGWVRLIVSDDGKGMPVSEIGKNDSNGLIGMRERVFALGGVLNLDSIAGDGVSVEIKLPFPSETSRRQKCKSGY